MSPSLWASEMKAASNRRQVDAALEHGGEEAGEGGGVGGAGLLGVGDGVDARRASTSTRSRTRCVAAAERRPNPSSSCAPARPAARRFRLVEQLGVANPALTASGFPDRVPAW
jgi:hypothetical protein